jgi:hypothetical protein
VVVDIKQPKFYPFLFRGVVLVELHLRQQQLGVVVVFGLEVLTPWQEANNLGWR